MKISRTLSPDIKTCKKITFYWGELKQSRSHLDLEVWGGGVVSRCWWAVEMAEDNEVWFHSSGFPAIKLLWVGAVGGTGLTEGIQTGFLTITAAFTKASHGIFLGISAYIRSLSLGLPARLLVFHSFYGGPTTLMLPDHHSPLELLLQCCASASLSVPVEGSVWSVGEVVVLHGPMCGRAPAKGTWPCFHRPVRLSCCRVPSHSTAHSSAGQGCTPPPHTVPWASLLASPIVWAHARCLDNVKTIFPLLQKELERIFNSLTECLGLSRSGIFSQKCVS